MNEDFGRFGKYFIIFRSDLCKIFDNFIRISYNKKTQKEQPMKKNFFLPVLVLSALILGVSANHSFGGAQESIAEGDSLYHLFDNLGAEAKYMQALKLEPNNAEIIWRISRAKVDIGEHLPVDQQEPYFEEAVSYADKAIGADPKNAEAHLRRAIGLGKLALHKGVFKSISLVKQVKESLDESLRLDSGNPTTHYALGRTHHKLCEKPAFARKLLGLGWASEDIGVKEYETSIKMDGTFIMYRLDYAKFLIELERYPGAKAQLQKIADLPIRDEDDEAYKKEAAGMLKDKMFK